MKRILISFLISMLLPAALFTGCGKGADSGQSTEDSSEASDVASEDREGSDDKEGSDEKSSDDNDDNKESGDDDEGVFGDDGDSSDKSVLNSKKKSSKDDSDGEWQKAYVDYLKSNPPEDGSYTYALIYVNDDDIPELVIDTGFEAGGCQIMTFHDGATDVLQTSRLYFTYIERGNLLNNCAGHMGYYYDYIYSIEDGKWVDVFSGEYSGFADDGEPEYDEETGRYICTDYMINGKETDEAGYYRELDKVYDSSKQKDVTSYIPYDELITYLNTGKLPYEDHRYELFVKDCTWDQARADCERMGGYLACMTTDEEFKTVEDLIRKEGKTDICFYVGGTMSDFSWIWIEPGLKYNSCLGNGYYSHWLNGGPSYTDKLSDGTEIDETCVELIYKKSEDKFYLNDVTNDVPGVYPSFRGRIGYICEYAD